MRDVFDGVPAPSQTHLLLGVPVAREQCDFDEAKSEKEGDKQKAADHPQHVVGGTVDNGAILLKSRRENCMKNNTHIALTIVNHSQ